MFLRMKKENSLGTVGCGPGDERVFAQDGILNQVHLGRSRKPGPSQSILSKAPI